MSDTEIMLTGRTSPPELPHRLRCGQMELELDGADVRRVGYRGIEVVSQLYFAFRDAAWNALPGVLSDVRIEDGPGRQLRATYTSRHAFPALGLDLACEGTIVGTEAGELTYGIEVTAHTPIDYNRIGLNLLHGARTYAGRPYRSRLGEDEVSGSLPRGVGAQPIVDGRLDGLLKPFRRLELSPVDGVFVEMDFDGDDFEAEDQRNFGDSTFKVYSTPIQRPAPFRLEAGETLRQSVRIVVRDERAREDAAAPAEAPLLVSLGRPTGRRLPSFGLGQASDDVPLLPSEADRVVALAPDHLRVELVLSEGLEACRARLDASVAEAGRLGCALWVDVTATSDDATVLDEIGRALCAAEPQPAYVYLATTMAEPPDVGESVEMLARLRSISGTAAPSMGVGVGSYMFFADLNRAAFDGAVVEYLTFATSPTVHRADDDTVLENLDGLGDAVEAVRRHLGRRPLSVGPITLATRHGPYPNGPAEPGQPDARVDPRQPSLFAAAVCLGHLAAYAHAGVDGLTFFETVGPMGVMEREVAPQIPGRDGPGSAAVFPLWHVLADAAEWRGGELLATALAPPPVFTPSVASLAVLDGTGVHLLLASLRRRPQAMTIDGLPGRSATVRVLDATTAPGAMRDPLAFRAGGTDRPLADGRLELRLAGYACVRIDAT